MADTDPFYSFGDRVSRQESPAERSRILRRDANKFAAENDDQVPVQSGRRFVTSSGSRVGPVSATKSNNAWRFNSSVEDPYQAQQQNAKLSALVAERAKKYVN